MARTKDPEVALRERRAELQDAKLELAVAQDMYKDMLRLGVGEKSLAKGREVIREWRMEISIIENEISAIAK